MTYENLNNYILNYIQNNKTKSAIMLTGGWGIGKSYYIQNTLKSFLDSNNKKCVVVSLYGLNEIDELSREIYFEIRFKSIQFKNEALKASAIMGKTVIKGIASACNVDISQNDNDWKKLYESIDLSNKLIILEDVERTNIDIIKLLGYVNNLVDQSNVKILLVANEDFILKYENPYDENKVLTKESAEYLKVKEKTVSDTIHFCPEFNTSILSLLNLFGKEKALNNYKNSEFCDNLLALYEIPNSFNFRTFIFATQKFLDIVNAIKTNSKKDYQQDFIDSIYYGIILFSIKLKEKEIDKWRGTDNYSFDLGSFEYPLYKFCFDYIIYQELNLDSLGDCYNDYIELFNHEKIISKFRNYFILREREISDTIDNLIIKLEKNEISLGIYREILKYLVIFEIDLNLDFDMSRIINIMEKNVKGKIYKLGGEIDYGAIGFNSDHKKENRYNQIWKLLIKSAATLNKEGYFLCDINSIEQECSKIKEFYFQNNSIVKHRIAFATNIDTENFSELFLQSHPKSMYIMRDLFQYIYDSNKSIEDIDEMMALKNLLKSLMNNKEKFIMDKIQTLNYNCYIRELDIYIEQLENVLRKKFASNK